MTSKFPHTVFAIGLMASLTPLQQASAQDAPTTTVPATGTGGPQAIDLSPKSERNEKMGTIPRTELPIPEIVSGASDFTTLAGAIRAAGLEASLNSDGNFTLFAPDNDAFAALPDGALAELMKPGNVELLRKILSYHVVPQKLTAAELTPGKLTTSSSEELTVVGAAEGKLTIQEAEFGTTDVLAKNGVIHVVKSVMIPPSVSLANLVPKEETE